MNLAIVERVSDELVFTSSPGALFDLDGWPTECLDVSEAVECVNRGLESVSLPTGSLLMDDDGMVTHRIACT